MRNIIHIIITLFSYAEHIIGKLTISEFVIRPLPSLYFGCHSMRENMTATKEMKLSLQDDEQNVLRQMEGLLIPVRKLECERHQLGTDVREDY
jgi:hypothetical protein